VLTEPGELGVTVDERLRRGRDNDLAAVPGRGDTRCPVQLPPGIALPGDLCLPRVKAHAHLDGPGGQRSLPRGSSRERRLRVREDI